MSGSSNSGQRSNEEQNRLQRKPQGLLKSYHGVVYQIQWIMIVALQARREGVNSGFTFRTEEDENDVGKFDDVVWQYQDGLEKKYNFLQCKHKLNPLEKITMNELCKKADKDKNPFSLQKYFISHRDYIKPNPKYKDGLIENLIIATNIDIEDTIKNSFKVLRKINPVLKVIKSMCETVLYPQCWKLDSSCVHQDIVSILEETYDLIKLVKVLGEYIRNQLPVKLPNNLKLYSKALYDNILDPEENRLSDDFINGNNLCTQAELFREAFFHELFVKKRMSLSLTCDCILSNPTEFAKAFAVYLQHSKDKKVEIQRKASIIKTNIDKLAGYVLIEEDGLKFNYKFWTTCYSELPHESLNIFRTVLIELLQQFDLLDAQDSQITIANKLDAYRFKITNFVTCRKELIDELSFWDSAKSYNGFQNICDIAKSSKEKQDLPNYSINNIKKNIDDFFDLLVFAVGYSRECLSKFVQYDLRDDFGCINNEHIADAFRSEIAKSLDLAEDRFISSSKDVDFFFDTAKQQINRFVLIGPTLEHRTRLFLHGIKFSENSIKNIKLRPFLTKSSMEQIIGINAVHKNLSSIKVHQILESIIEYKCKNQSNAYIFMCLSTVFCLLDMVIQNFEFNCNLLVIECDTMTTTLDDEKYLSSEISRIVTQSCNKKVVLICEENNSLAKILKNNLGSKFKEAYDKRNNFLNLNKSSQDNLLSKTTVVFQGEQITLSELLEDNIKYLVNDDVLYNVIKGEEIEIGVEFSGLGKVKDYYINRTFCRRLALKIEVFKENDMFAISNTDILELSKEINTLFRKSDSEDDVTTIVRQFNEEDHAEHNPKRFIILNNDHSGNQFESLCRTYERCNIHWLNKENGVYIWQHTYGSLSKLHSYLKTDTKEYKEIDGKFANAIKLTKVTIISAEPGMGKSTVTTNLESLLKTDPNLWVVRINLLHYSTDFKDFIDEAFVTKFIYKAAKLNFLSNKEYSYPLANIVTVYMRDGQLFLERETDLKSLELFEIRMFNHYYNLGKVVLLFDGFDEICSFYEEKVNKLLNILYSSSVVHMFITTRPYNILNNLENTLNEFSYALKPLTNDEQRLFLKKYWKSHLNLNNFDESRAKIFIAEILHRFSEATNDEQRNFVGIPLQLRMLADNFQDVFAEFYHSNVRSLNDVYKAKIKRKLNIVHLYEDFVNVKFEKIRFKEKKPGVNTDFTDMQEIINRERRKFIDDHRKLALYALFKDNVDTLFISNENHGEQNYHLYIQELLENINDGDEEIGIINCVIDQYPIFVHQSYAEYFVGSYLWEKFKTIKITNYKEKFIKDLLINKIFMGKHLQICRFFYCSAEKDLKENVYFDDRDDKIIYLLENLVSIISNIYCLYHNGGIDKENGTDDLSSRDDEIIRNRSKFFKSSITDFYDSVNYVPCMRLMFRIIECYLSGNEPQRDAIKTIIKKDKSNNLLLMAAELGCLNFVKIFVTTKQLDYKGDLTTMKWYFTPIWLAAKKQHVEVVKYLSYTHNPNWNDKDGCSLLQRIYNNNEINVLRSCLVSNIVDGSPFKNRYYSNSEFELPLSKALLNHYPADIIRLLLKKSNYEVINKLTDGRESNIIQAMAISLTEYDKETIDLVVNCGINFFGVLNVLLFEYCYASFDGPTNLIKLNKSLSYFCSDTQFTDLPNFIKLLLRAGIGFNSKDNYHNKSTLQYIKQTYYINTLLNEIATVEKPIEKILKLVFEMVLDVGRIKIGMSNTNIPEIILLHGANNKTQILIPDRLVQQLTELFSKSYHDISSCLYRLRYYIQNAKQEINHFKDYPDSTLYENILTGYEEMLEFIFAHEKHKTEKYKSLGNVEKMLLKRVLRLYIRQGYDIEAAFKDVAAEVLKVKALSTWMTKTEDFRSSTTAEELLKILNSGDVEITKELKTKASKIYKCGGLETLCRIWSNLNEVGQQNVSEVLRSMTKYMSVSKEIYELLNSLEKSYDNLTVAIRSRHFTEIENVLQNVESSFKKAVINGQDDEYGSPLHYVVYNGDAELTSLLLSHGGNPNFKLAAHGTLLSQLASEELEEDAIEENYEGHTSLHLAVLRAQVHIVQLLLSYGANCDIENNLRCNSLQLAEEKLVENEHIFKEIINILKNASQSTIVAKDTDESGPSDSKRKRTN